MDIETLFADLRTLLEVHFVQQALFELVAGNSTYNKLLVVNHHNSFFSLSNAGYYIFLLPVTGPQIMAEVCEYKHYIFNRKCILVQLENSGGSADFEAHFCLQVSDVIRQAKERGLKENNLYLCRLSELFRFSEEVKSKHLNQQS